MCKTLKEIIEAGKYIRCCTIEDAKLLLKWAHLNGLTWNDGTSYEVGPLCWDIHKEHTMYNLKGGFISIWEDYLDQSDILEFNLVAAEVGEYLKLLQRDPMKLLQKDQQPTPTPAYKTSPIKTQPECYEHPVAGLFIQVKLHVEGEGTRAILMPVMPVTGDFVQLGDNRLCKIHTRVLGISALELYGRVVENNDGGN